MTERTHTRPPGLFAAITGRWLFKLAAGIETGRVTIELPDGRIETVTGRIDGPSASMHIRNWRAVRRIILGGDIGFAEGYIAGDWSTDDLTALLALIACNYEGVETKADGTWMIRAVDRIKHTLRANTKSGSKRNIRAHYDLGNGFYREWLDPTMTYSAALYERPNDPLEIAQIRKYERIAEHLKPNTDSHILEIGCGWGGFATFAARKYGCRVTGITLSQEQHDFARERAVREGVADKVDIRLQDYRDVKETFDAIASIEMFEAVGENNWPRYFRTVTERLKEGGLAALQVITIDETRFETYRKGADFIQHYVFPGGMLPSPTIFERHAKSAGLAIDDSHFFGQSYAKTLAEWQSRFADAWPAIERSGFDGRFKRIWEYYLAYCRAGFETGGIDVGQFVLKRT